MGHGYNYNQSHWPLYPLILKRRKIIIEKKFLVLKKGPKIFISAQPDWILKNLTKIFGLISKHLDTMANDYGNKHFFEMFPMNYAKKNAISKMS